jgi:hypothetical protein
MKNKYMYRLVIRGNFGECWEDMCDYDTKTERKDCFADIKEYRSSGQGSYKIITRRVPNE